jgi:hypothetical protein
LLFVICVYPAEAVPLAQIELFLKREANSTFRGKPDVKWGPFGDRGLLSDVEVGRPLSLIDIAHHQRLAWDVTLHYDVP